MDQQIYHRQMCTQGSTVDENPPGHAQVHMNANGHKSSKAVWRHYMTESYLANDLELSEATSSTIS